MFKVGDTVKCVNDTYYRYIKHGDFYLVVGIDELGQVLVNGKAYGYPPHCFEKVNKMTTTENKTIINEKAKPKATAKPQANTFYVRRVGGGSPKVVHSKFEDAKNEADRLSLLCPNEEYQVLAVAYSVKKIPVYTTESTEYSV